MTEKQGTSICSHVPISQEEKLSGMGVTSNQEELGGSCRCGSPSPGGLSVILVKGLSKWGQNLGFKVTQL